MATFITTIKFTEQGIKDIAQTTKRAETFKTAARSAGANVKDVYWTLGDYDGVLIFEASDDESATALLLQLAALGNVHTTTVRAFTSDEMAKILSRVHKG